MELPLDRPVARTDVILHHVTDDQPYVLNLGELVRRPIVQESRALDDHGGNNARSPREALTMEGTRVQPETVDGTAKTKPFGRAQETPVLKVGLPFLDGIDFLPFLGDTADLDHLL